VQTKKCSRCKDEKPVTEFGINRATRDGLAYYCKEPCSREIRAARPKEEQREAARRYRERHGDKVRAAVAAVPLEKKRAYKAATRARCEAIVLAAMRAAGKCADCPETHLDVMDFDHIPERGPKIASISKLKLSGRIKALTAELAKCEMVCIKCHRRRSALRGEWTGRVLS
jgi:hypothetical protein